MHSLAIACSLAALGFASAALGRTAARQQGNAWRWLAGISSAAILLCAIGLASRQLSFVAPFSWVVTGWHRWLCFSTAVPMLFGILSSLLRGRRVPDILSALSASTVLKAALLPALAPLSGFAEMQKLPTVINEQGVCLQRTPYTCGPAACVTALGPLGIKAEESELGIVFGTTALTGTPDDILVPKLREHFADEHLVVEHRYVSSLDELRAYPVSLAIINLSFSKDHWVAVLGIDENSVTLGDPDQGKVTLTRAEFEAKWCHVAVMLKR
jgi:hypothetical protein